MTDTASLERFQSCGIPDNFAKDAAKPKSKLGPIVHAVLDAAGGSTYPKTTGALLYSIASKFSKEVHLNHRSLLAQMVAKGDIASNAQLDAALRHLSKHVGMAESLDQDALEKACGVGVVVSDESLEAAAKLALEEVSAELAERRYRYPVGMVLRGVMKREPWADGKKAKELLEKMIAEILGPKTEADAAPPKKMKKEPKGGDAKKKSSAADAEKKKKDGADAAEGDATAAAIRKLPGPSANTFNKPDILDGHLKRTGAQMVTRFPPEPNGFLHIGHAKAMNLSFTAAATKEATAGSCILRFDDTNPEQESQEFIDSITEDVKWLGWKPARITHSSDYFDKLFEIALDLIDRDLAYVCHQNKEQIALGREKKQASPWRNRPIEESRKLFIAMSKGKYAEGEASLRLKMDMTSDNTAMRDPIAYRIKYVPHPRTGDKYCVYPTYDYTHCLVDSLEDVTHSLCTLEFEVRHEPYMKLLDMANMYKPFVWEFSRLGLSNSVMSKRKLKQLVTEGHVRGWDDPRLCTVKGFRRRGYTPEAINAFCRNIGVTRNDGLLDMNVLEQFARSDINDNGMRGFCVLDPLKVVITNWPEGKVESIEAPMHPARPECGTRTMPLSRVVYIERDDFKTEDVKGYHGLAPGKIARLRYAHVIRCEKFVPGSSEGEIKEIHVSLASDAEKPKGVLHWVSEPAPGVSPARVECRLYNRTLTVFDPADMDKEEGANWLDFFNKEAEVVVPDALVEPALTKANVGDKFQFERVGYFCVDKDSTESKKVFNRTVTLKESKGRKEVATK